LAKRYTNYAYDIIQLLAGSLERSDGVFMVLLVFVSLFPPPLCISLKLYCFFVVQKDFVSSLDTILQDVSAPGSLQPERRLVPPPSDLPISARLRHRTLLLALLFASSINQGSINAYFLRRDLFSTLVKVYIRIPISAYPNAYSGEPPKFITDSETQQFALPALVLLGVLANFRKYEAHNPYLVRWERTHVMVPTVHMDSNSVDDFGSQGLKTS
jgi:hypothetical protein